MTNDVATIQDWINKVNEEGRNLSKWEQDFIDSVTERFETSKWITDRQEEILERIYTEKVP